MTDGAAGKQKAGRPLRSLSKINESEVSFQSKTAVESFWGARSRGKSAPTDLSAVRS